jgi:hypothetical protein
MGLLSSLNVEALQGLTVLDVEGDVPDLLRATKLTGLELEITRDNCWTENSPKVGRALARISTLRSLALDLQPDGLQLGPILRASTGLTYLRYNGKFTVGDELEACASLPSLRCLELVRTDGVTPANLSALQAMSSLDELALRDTGIREDDLAPEVRAVFDVERLCRGWPPLKLQCSMSR